MTSEEAPALTALTEIEREALRNVTGQRRQCDLELAARSVADLELALQDFAGSWDHASFERVRVRDCRLVHQDLRKAQFRDVVFEGVSFESCLFDDATFHDCRFQRCELREGTFHGTSLHGCSFDGSSLIGTILYSVRFDGVQMAGGALREVRLSQCMVHLLELDKVQLESVRFTLCEAGRVVLTGCDATNWSLLGGRFGWLEIQGGSLSNVSTAEAKVRTLHVHNVEKASRLLLNDSEFGELSLQRCHVSSLYVSHSAITQLQLRGGSYRGWITECKLGTGSRIEEAALIAFFWDKSEAVGLTLSNVQLERGLCAREARFEGLALQDVSYAPDLRLVLDGASFSNGDSFHRT